MLNITLFVKQKFGALDPFLKKLKMKYGTYFYKLKTGGFSFTETERILKILDIKYEEIKFIKKKNAKRKLTSKTKIRKVK